jgi:DNA-binding response OmpR family regulator
MKLLVVEDEQKLAQYLQKGLGTAGFVVDLAHDGVTGLHMSSGVRLRRHHPRLHAARHGRPLPCWLPCAPKKQTPVLMLTALGKVEDRVNGLQTGADDYLVKPFAFSELIARIHGTAAPLGARSNRKATSNRLALHDLEMDLARRKVLQEWSAHRPERQGVPAAFSVSQETRRGAVANRDCRAGLGYEFRQQHQRRRSFDQATARQNGYALRATNCCTPYAAWVMSSNCANETWET